VNRFYQTLYTSLPIPAQNLLCTLAGHRRYRDRFNDRFRDRLREWEESVNEPPDALHEIQRRRLAALVERARAHGPHDRDLPPPDTHPDAREAVARTLAAIPPLAKSVYRDQPGDFLARDVPRFRLRRSQTSGTTGTALPVWYTLDTLAEEFATVWRMRRACGVADPREPNLTFNGRIVVPFDQTRPPFWRKNRAVQQTLFSIYHMTPENLRDYVSAIHTAPARYVQGYPSAIHLVARSMLREGRPMAPGRLAAVFTSSESLLAFQRETIEKAFGAPVVDRYGMSEFGASMTQCPVGRLHVDMEFGIVEVEVTEETDETETGPLLVTGLGQVATPLFRYRIGDVGTRLRRPCACGRAGDAFVEIDGRVEDYVLTPDGRLIGRLDHAFKDQFDVAEAQILQEDARAIEVLVVPRAGYASGSERHLLRELRTRLGNEIAIRTRRVERIPREPNGKFRLVKSRVGRLAA